MTSTTNRKSFRISVLSIWIGILIPIFAGLIPFALKYFLPEHHLEYEITGPIVVKDRSMMSIAIVNKGEKTEKNVIISIDVMRFPKIIKEKAVLNDFIIDSKSKYSVSTEGNHYIISIGDLRPREKVKLSVMLYGVIHYYGSSLIDEDLSIKSDDNVAQNSTPSEELLFFYQFGFWMFILLMVIMGIGSIYFEFIMHPKKKEKYFVDQLEKVRKKIPEKNIE